MQGLGYLYTNSSVFAFIGLVAFLAFKTFCHVNLVDFFMSIDDKELANWSSPLCML